MQFLLRPSTHLNSPSRSSMTQHDSAWLRLQFLGTGLQDFCCSDQARSASPLRRPADLTGETWPSPGASLCSLPACSKEVCFHLSWKSLNCSNCNLKVEQWLSDRLKLYWSPVGTLLRCILNISWNQSHSSVSSELHLRDTTRPWSPWPHTDHNIQSKN